MGITLPGFEVSSYTDANQKWDGTLWVSVKPPTLRSSKTSLSTKVKSETRKVQLTSTLCFHWCNFTCGNEVKTVSLTSFLWQAGGLFTPKNKVRARGERWGRELCPWHYVLNGYLSSLISSDVKREKRGTRATGMMKPTWIKGQASRALPEAHNQKAKTTYSLQEWCSFAGIQQPRKTLWLAGHRMATFHGLYHVSVSLSQDCMAATFGSTH